MSIFNKKPTLSTITSKVKPKLQGNVFIIKFLQMYNSLNILVIYMFILLVLFLSYEIIPFNEELISITCVFLAFITIDKLASQVIHATFQEEQQVLFLTTIKKSFDVFALCLLQKAIEKRSIASRVKKKLFFYSFLHDLLFFLNYFDYILIHLYDFEEAVHFEEMNI